MRPLPIDARDVRIAELEHENAELVRREAQLTARVEALERENGELQATAAALKQENAALATKLAALTMENAALRKRPARTSRNSNRPPSSDPPGEREKRPRAKPTGRPPGGQPGHPKHPQNLVPPEQVTAVHDCIPGRCKGCHTPLKGTDPNPEIRQRVEVPKIVLDVHEYRLHTLPCDECGERTQATPPDELRHGAYGPRLLALVALLTGVYRLPKRRAQRFLSDVFGVEMSVGMVSKCERRMSMALMGPVREVGIAVSKAPCVNIDETGWFQEGRLFWLWAASTPTLAYFWIDESRGAEVAKSILGPDFQGIVVSDRLASYAYIDPEQRQVCWSHLDRNFQELVDIGGPGARLGHALLNLSRKMWHVLHQFRDGKRTEDSVQTFLAKLRKSVHKVLTEFAPLKIPKASALARNLLKIEPALWTFAAHLNVVEPTNNAGERTLRTAVILRKIILGTQSSRGSRFTSRVLTAAETLYRQGRRVYSYFIDAIDCYLHGRPSPSLLPLQPQPP